MTIYVQGKPVDSGAITGLEHLQRGQSAFAWQVERPADLKFPDATVPDFTGMDWKEAQRIKGRDAYRAKQEGFKSLKDYYAALILRKNPYMEIAKSTTGQGVRADQIRRGGR